MGKTMVPLDGLLLKARRKRPRAPRSLVKWRAKLIHDLGGADKISAQRSALVEMVVRTRLYIDQLDEHLLTLETVVRNKKKKTLWPMVRERQTLADSMARMLEKLGLDRATGLTPDEELNAYLEEPKHEDNH